MHGIIMSLQNRLQAILGREYGMPWNKAPGCSQIRANQFKVRYKQCNSRFVPNLKK